MPAENRSRRVTERARRAHTDLRGSKTCVVQQFVVAHAGRGAVDATPERRELKTRVL